MNYLSDRGIRQAIGQGLLRFDPPLADNQLQPASVDIKLSHIDEIFQLEQMTGGPCGPDVAARDGFRVPSRMYADMVCTQQMGWTAPLRFRTELRSSLRRLSCYTPTGLTMMLRDRLHVEMNNPGPIDIQLAENDKIAQLLFFFYKEMDIGFHEAGFAGFEEIAAGYEQLLTLDHGWTISDSKTAKRLVMDGYLEVNPCAKFERGLLRVHAGKTARVLRDDVRVDFSKKTDIASFFKTVDLPYRFFPGEHIIVDVEERLALSPHVGIQFFDYLLGSSRSKEFFPSSRSYDPDRAIADISLLNIPDGWIDPGYVGSFSRQPKTYSPDGVMVREGDLLGHGMIIFFPNSVGRAYGDAALGSHYQGQNETRLSQ